MNSHEGGLEERQWLHDSNVVRVVAQDPRQTGPAQLFNLFCNGKDMSLHQGAEYQFLWSQVFQQQAIYIKIVFVHIKRLTGLR